MAFRFFSKNVLEIELAGVDLQSFRPSSDAIPRTCIRAASLALLHGDNR